MKNQFVFLLLTTLLITGCHSGGSSVSTNSKVKISRYVSQVSDTLPYRISKSDQGQTVNYVVSSNPVVENALLKDSTLSIYSDIRTLFSEKYSTNGFPQAGLFIKKSLAQDRSKSADILSFLSTVDSTIAALESNPESVKSQIDEAMPNLEQQTSKFGMTTNLILNVQKDSKNGFGFLDKKKQPDHYEYEKIFTTLSINIDDKNFSSYYYAPYSTRTTSSLSFQIASPVGAPSLAFSAFASDDKFITESPNLMKAEFAKGEKDFIIFDSINGRKLCEDKYEFVSMVTYGNLYVISLGNDSDGIRNEGDYVVSYGEGLIPDLVFKSVYGVK